MPREERSQYLNTIRQTDPVQLIEIYRAATKTPPMDQLPRGLGFTGMIEAILASEFDAGPSGNLSDTVPLAELSLPGVSPAKPTRRMPTSEFKAFCSGAALVGTGLLMAALYFLVKDQLLA